MKKSTILAVFMSFIVISWETGCFGMQDERQMRKDVEYARDKFQKGLIKLESAKRECERAIKDNDMKASAACLNRAKMAQKDGDYFWRHADLYRDFFITDNQLYGSLIEGGKTRFREAMASYHQCFVEAECRGPSRPSRAFTLNPFFIQFTPSTVSKALKRICSFQNKWLSKADISDFYGRLVDAKQDRRSEKDRKYRALLQTENCELASDSTSERINNAAEEALPLKQYSCNDTQHDCESRCSTADGECR